MSEQSSNLKAALAAAIIMASIFVAMYFMPKLLYWIAGYNEWLAYGTGALFILAFFAVFWLRARYQKKRGE